MSIQEMEKYLCQVRSVHSCKILQDDSGEIQEVHIISDTGRSPKQISRDIQSVFMTKFGVNLDHKKISIAQIKSEDMEYADFRLKFKALECLIDDRRSEVKVILEKDDELYEGIVSGPNTAGNALRMPARATLHAVENFFGLEDSFILEDIKIISLSGRDTVVVAVASVLGDKEQMLSGSAVVEGDMKEAAVKAALSAVNRVICKFSR